jgi:8-oxo-dGTP pyrophosphatase MutT (NUDIX family)
MERMRLRPWWFYNQSAVIPYKLTEGSVEVLLVTSRRRKRWVIPKGVIDPGLSAKESALKEAFEEAGISGNISSEPIGEYSYDKWGGTCTVKVFLLEVQTIYEQWPEADTRARRWMMASEAAQSVKESKLRKIILSAQDSLS